MTVLAPTTVIRVRGGNALWRGVKALSGILPFSAYIVIFLGVPALAVLLGAFQSPSGGFTMNNLHVATSGVYRQGFIESVELSAITSVVPGIVGIFVAYAVHTSRYSFLRHLVSTASGVFTNFGGVPLAFLFVASLGTTGVATSWLTDIGFNPYDHGFNLYRFGGLVVVYMYFQIPLMVLVVTPALGGLRPAFREAADNLGAGRWHYWRFVGIPILLPSAIGAMLLLFGSALSAYATADALTSGAVPLTSIQIGSFLSGDVISGQQNVGNALSFVLILIVGAVMILYTVLQRKASRWLR